MAPRPQPPRSLDPTAESYLMSWPALFERVGDLFEQARLYYFPISEGRVKFTTDMIAAVSSIREYAISSDDDVEAIWAALRSKGQVGVDLIMQLTGDIVLELGGVHVFPTYVTQLAQAIHVIVPRQGTGTTMEFLGVTDDPFTESLGSVETLKKHLTENPWLFTLFLLRRSGRLSLLRSIVGNPPAEE